MYNERAMVPAYQRIAFCLVGVATPDELIKDRRTTPYNVGKTLWLGDFDASRDDLAPLVENVLSDDPGTRRGLAGAGAVLDRRPSVPDHPAVPGSASGRMSQRPKGVDRYVDQRYATSKASARTCICNRFCAS